jgi:4-diphosphocytidyl-2-C-methyl-D-erythritol kinase
MIRTARLKAYAKLNLGLRVLYKRPDNYHELRTVFQTISLADSLEIEYSSGKATSISIEGTPEIPDNLVERAARLVLQEIGVHARLRFRLKKRIPAGAGLGGGSSDAAAVLLALPVLAGKPIPGAELHAMATELGSDVPFFLEGGAALGLGRGEELYPLPDRPATKGLLVSPPVQSGTAEAYRDVSVRLTSIPLQNKLFSFRQEVWQGFSQAGSGAGSGALGSISNDFQEGVFARYPELSGIAEWLIRSGARPVAMTGSGSSIFGIFQDRERMLRARKSRTSGTGSNEQIFEISFLSRSQYRSAWKRALRQHTKGDLWPPRSRYAR